MNELKLNVSKVISAPIHKVFDAWLDPEKLSKFMKPMPGMSDAVVLNDSKVGGKFQITMISGDNKMLHEGEYIEISRHNRLVFTWKSSSSVDNSTVTIDFLEIAPLVTEVNLIHVKFVDEETRDNHIGGWTGILDTFSNCL